MPMYTTISIKSPPQGRAHQLVTYYLTVSPENMYHRLGRLDLCLGTCSYTYRYVTTNNEEANVKESKRHMESWREEREGEYGIIDFNFKN